MTTPNDGGPAFPVTPMDRGGVTADTFLGMSLRDYFAAKALTGFLANASNDPIIRDAYKADGETPEKLVSAMCYGFADAMIAERNRKP